MKLSLTLITGEKLDFKVNKESVTIGRSAQCDVVVPAEGMSRKHCLLEVKNGDLFVTDLGSSNGVFVEGEKIAPNTPFPYSTYLSLSFGAVQSVSIETDDSRDTQTQDKSDISSPSLTSPKMARAKENTKTRILKPADAPAAATAKKADQGKLYKVIGFVVVLAVAAYFLTKEEPSTEMTPEEMYN